MTAAGAAARVDELCREVARLVGVDPERALELAGEAQALAEAADDDAGRAKSARAAANALHFSGRSAEAQELYRRALAAFERQGDASQAAVTRSSALLNLAYLGAADEAAAWYAAAREAFLRQGDRPRLAVLEHNWANVLYRQDRWEEALARYRAAYEELRALGRAFDAAVALRNIATCRISLHDFPGALAAYEECRRYAAAEDLGQILLEIDYNVAYLHYLRGEYARAIDLFRAARRRSDEAGDDYHRALCDLDESEIDLELRLTGDAARLASRAEAAFARLGMPYETAKAITNAAIAASRRGHGEEALSGLARARAIFVAERNRLWPALVDLYRAVVLARMGRPAEARFLAEEALVTFTEHGYAPRAATCELLLAELDLEAGDATAARARCRAALARLEPPALPALEVDAHGVLGRVEERAGDRAAALGAYEAAHRGLERLRGQLAGEDARIAFLGDHQALYEGLVTLVLEAGEPDAAERAFAYVEAAKSRALQDLLALRAAAFEPRAPAPRELAVRARELRRDLHWLYRSIDRRHLAAGEAGPPGRDGELRRLRGLARRREEELLVAVRELQASDGELGALHGVAPDLGAVRAALPADAALVEFFVARGRLLVAVLDGEGLQVVPLGPAGRARELQRLVDFELSRARAPAAASAALDALRPLAATALAAHLRELGEILLAPVAPLLARERLVVVPHGFLHHVPFHALGDGDGWLVDRAAVSYAPSAAVFQLCAAKETAWEDRALVVGVADRRAPRIAEEARAVAATLPRATLLLGEEATLEAFAAAAAAARWVHVATHGLFRRDNPMFSALRLGASRLALADLYELRLAAELVTLSGCGTGVSAVLGADELVGLARGLLYAGAQAVLVSLWEVDDASATALMASFYRHLAAGVGRADALRTAMLELRRSYPSPYHWAPFALVGKPG